MGGRDSRQGWQILGPCVSSSAEDGTGECRGRSRSLLPRGFLFRASGGYDRGDGRPFRSQSLLIAWESCVGFIGYGEIK